jgi:hypothetical protein
MKVVPVTKVNWATTIQEERWLSDGVLKRSPKLHAELRRESERRARETERMKIPLEPLRILCRQKKLNPEKNGTESMKINLIRWMFLNVNPDVGLERRRDREVVIRIVTRASRRYKWPNNVEAHGLNPGWKAKGKSWECDRKLCNHQQKG